MDCQLSKYCVILSEILKLTEIMPVEKREIPFTNDNY